jgi:RecA/RadA recombinase
MSLLDKMLKAGSIKSASVLSKSSFFNTKEVIPTDLPILNIAFSGSLEGGLLPGLTVVAGASKSFKTMLSLYCMKAYLDKHQDGVAILYDSEFGITPDYLESFNIDINRVIHIPLENVEQLKFDIVQRLNEIEKKDNVFIMIDSIGNLASKKEVEDAENEKSVADMSRAKSLKSLFRIITPHLTTKSIPCIAINHIYQEMGLYPKAIVSGGTGIYYSANQIFIISKAQEKDGTELAGFKFTINIEKSRYVKEKSKLPFSVFFDSGIYKWSSLFELAQESGHIIKPKVGWYQIVDMETGEISDKSYRAKDLESNDAYFEGLIKDKSFKEYVERKFKLTGGAAGSSQHDVDDEEVDIDE